MKLRVLVKRWDLCKSQYIIYNGSLYLINYEQNAYG